LKLGRAIIDWRNERKGPTLDGDDGNGRGVRIDILVSFQEIRWHRDIPSEREKGRGKDITCTEGIQMILKMNFKKQVIDSNISLD